MATQTMETKEGKVVAATTSCPGGVQDPATAIEPYRGRTPGPYVPGTSWKTWWRLFQNFLVLRKVSGGDVDGTSS